jgi:hypothetical protein
MRDKVQVSSPQYNSFATPVIAGYCDAGTMCAVVITPFRPALATLCRLSSLNGFPKFNPFSILLIFRIINLFTILDGSGLF